MFCAQCQADKAELRGAVALCDACHGGSLKEDAATEAPAQSANALLAQIRAEQADRDARGVRRCNECDGTGKHEWSEDFTSGKPWEGKNYGSHECDACHGDGEVPDPEAGQ